MENTPDEDKPLFVDDITGTEPSADAGRASIEETIAAMQARNPAQRNLLDSTAEAQYMRQVSLGVLKRLATMGVEDADILAVALGVIDPPERPMTASLLTVASIFEQRLAQLSGSESQTRRLALKRQSSLARAADSIVNAQAVQGASAPTPKDLAQGATLVRIARRTIGDEAENLSAATNTALDIYVTEIESTVQLPPQQ